MTMDIEKARVRTAGDEDHPTLFPLTDFSYPPRSPQALCKRLGLNWMTAVNFYKETWLSFDPETTEKLSPAQEAELVLLGSLVTAGCDGNVLTFLLSGLQKPYAYRLDRLYYDWANRCWRLLEDVDDLEGKFDEWIGEIVAWHELDRLERIRDRVESAILFLETRRKARAAG